jgi:hypothetical protein
MQGMIDQTDQSVRNQVNNLFGRSGASLGTQHAGVMTKELANAENSLRYQNYGNERNAMTQAAGMMPSLNEAQYAGIMPYLAAQQTAAGLPYQGIQNLGQIGGLFGGYGTQSGTQPGGWGSGLLGAAATIGSALISKSDRRLKKNIVKVGEIEDGLNIYEWVYKNDPTEAVYRGVMADEVKVKRPAAYVPNYQGSGFDAVNYALIREAA